MMKQTYKYLRAFRNNGPDYWLVFKGKAVYGADPVARYETEDEARLAVDMLNKPLKEEVTR